MFADTDPETTFLNRTWGDRVGRVLGRLGGSAHGVVTRALRRHGCILENITAAKLNNLTRAGLDYLLGRTKVQAFPVVARIDITPLCNLRCTVCIHAEPNGNPALEKQRFSPDQRMSLADYTRIIEELKGRACAVFLFYLGDPLLHPDLDEMCRIARNAGLNVHFTTHFSIPLSDRRIWHLVRSGVTHLSVCVDGLTQETYGLTRVGGRIEHVLYNLRRVCAARKRLGRRYPRIEVQYIKFQHNLHELGEARRLVTSWGVNQFHVFWGGLHNYTGRDPGNFEVYGPRAKARVPRCHWPYVSLVIKYNGDVIPCAAYRLGEQYTLVDDPRCVGNVFKQGVWGVWNSPAYQELRRLVNCPQSRAAQPNHSRKFCCGCPRIAETDYEKTCLWGSEHTFEEVYERDAHGQPVRRRDDGRSDRL